MTPLQRLAQWYDQQCDGEWEHGHGFRITTLDNPGASLDVDLRHTSLESVPFEEVKDQYDVKARWMLCRRTEQTFQARGAACRLDDMIEEFLRWAERKGNRA